MNAIFHIGITVMLAIKLHGVMMILLHILTSGIAANRPTGVFDSSLFMAGATFSHTFEEEGTLDYFCMVIHGCKVVVMVGSTTTKSYIRCLN